jgi:hypothetical protein
LVAESNAGAGDSIGIIVTTFCDDFLKFIILGALVVLVESTGGCGMPCNQESITIRIEGDGG